MDCANNLILYGLEGEQQIASPAAKTLDLCRLTASQLPSLPDQLKR